ncbi:MAG: glycosyltransferase family 4 protein [Actinobacteria bacterium]|nr:glycosyltransferase family 4 protein [Actinomycetota bacterium]
MKVAQVAPIWYAIPPRGYGGIEYVVHCITEGLIKRGQDVTLFAAGDSITEAKLISSYRIAPSERIGETYPDLLHVMMAYQMAGEFDIIHDHSGLIGPVIGSFINTPVIHTLHGPATQEAKDFYGRIRDQIYFNAISDYQREKFGDLKFIGTIYNGVDLAKYDYCDKKEDFLFFLGRMNPEKGAHVAVEVARKTGKKLLMVSKMTEPHEKAYFKERVKPLLAPNVELIGEVDVETKIEMFKKASCVLFPVQWPEPFGLVMIEAMACGTPVIAIRNGSVPEVVVHEKTGYICSSTEEMIEAINKVDQVNPVDCRHHIENNFSTDHMVDHYIRAYKKIIKIEEENYRLLKSA